MRYREIAPGRAAARFIHCYWYLEVQRDDPEVFTHRVIPDGLTSIGGAISSSKVLQTMVVGPSDKAVTVEAKSSVDFVGIRLQPAATEAVLGVKARSLFGKKLKLDSFAPPIDAWLRDVAPMIRSEESAEIIDAATLALRPCAGSIDRVAENAAEALLSGRALLKVEELASQAGLSPRQFLRRFREAVGLPPKAFWQVRRLRAAWLASIEGDATNLSEVSAAGSFSDQPHFNRQVRKTIGLTPNQLRADLEKIRHEFSSKQSSPP